MKIQKVAIITAMKSEYDAVIKIATKVRKVSNTKSICIIGNKNVVVILSGVGKVAGALATQKTILEDKTNFIMNSGIAGSIDKEISIGEVVMASAVVYHDVDVTVFEYKLGQLPDGPEKYNARVLYHPQVKTGLIVSGDQFIENKKYNIIKKNFPEALAVEMEAGGIAQAAETYKVPYVIIRSISDDTIEQESVLDFKKFENQAAEKAALIIKELLEGAL